MSACDKALGSVGPETGRDLEIEALLAAGELRQALLVSAQALSGAGDRHPILTAAANAWVSAVDQGGILEQLTEGELEALYRGMVVEADCPADPPVFHHRIAAQHSGGVSGHLGRAANALNAVLRAGLAVEQPAKIVVLLALLLRSGLSGIDARRLSDLHRRYFQSFTTGDLRIPYSTMFDKHSFRANIDDLTDLVREEGQGLLNGSVALTHLLTLYWIVPSAFETLPYDWAARAIDARKACLEPGSEEAAAARSLALRFGIDCGSANSAGTFDEQMQSLERSRKALKAETAGIDSSALTKRLEQRPRQLLALSHHAASALLPKLGVRSGRPRVALCISGQLRGFRRTWVSWKPLLAGIDATVFVSTWKRIGHGTPEPFRYNLPFEGKSFCQTYKAVGTKGGLPELKSRYPDLFSRLEQSGNTSQKELEELYRTPFIDIDDENDPNFAVLSNSEKMYFKIQKCYEMAIGSGQHFDLMVRIRPDKPITAVAFEWADLINVMKCRPTLFCETAMGVHYGAISMGDQVAIGLPGTSELYARTAILAPDITALSPYRMEKSLSGHTSIAQLAWMHDIDVRKVPIKFGIFQEAEPLNIRVIDKAVQIDAAKRMDATDIRFLEAIRADMKT